MPLGDEAVSQRPGFSTRTREKCEHVLERDQAPRAGETPPIKRRRSDLSSSFKAILAHERDGQDAQNEEVPGEELRSEERAVVRRSLSIEVGEKERRGANCE
jgi:hypothetical protein